MPIPWDKVILHGPQVLDTAKSLYNKWQSRPKQEEAGPNVGLQTQFNSLLMRVKSLEDAEEKQAALATQLAEQNQALSMGVSELKIQIENLQKTIAENKETQNIIDDRMSELSAQLLQTSSSTSSINRKIALSIGIAAIALAISLIVLIKFLPK